MCVVKKTVGIGYLIILFYNIKFLYFIDNQYVIFNCAVYIAN